MGPIKAIVTCYVKIFNFADRARQAEYWWFVLFQTLVIFGAIFAWGYTVAMRVQSDPAFAQFLQSPGGAEAYVNSLFAGYVPYFVVGYVILFWLPMLSVSVRRLHDTDRGGIWLFINLMPLIGPIWFTVLMCLPGTRGDNRFGGDPISNRKAPIPFHPAFAGELQGEERDRAEVARRTAARDYYKRRVLPSIQSSSA